jgi:hypothetical protein
VMVEAEVRGQPGQRATPLTARWLATV